MVRGEDAGAGGAGWDVGGVYQEPWTEEGVEPEGYGVMFFFFLRKKKYYFELLATYNTQ